MFGPNSCREDKEPYQLPMPSPLDGRVSIPLRRLRRQSTTAGTTSTISQCAALRALFKTIGESRGHGNQLLTLSAPGFRTLFSSPRLHQPLRPCQPRYPPTESRANPGYFPYLCGRVVSNPVSVLPARTGISGAQDRTPLLCSPLHCTKGRGEVKGSVVPTPGPQLRFQLQVDCPQYCGHAVRRGLSTASRRFRGHHT